ncbi:dormancy-associated protein homolog 3-like isoform X2 [Triticum dicoccoides]|uniref:dormancy-associated protein homolog 3-like isoform X2 n=1 Tax=Triticum dicoccoides TaxID=85692 RepID=UPI0018908855|nr:dormancy-associated protein homolog 3-like isoform X2 [Triticum dicoccoides]
MGLLDKLWDDTVAGPQPDTGLGRLRKLAVRPAAVKINDVAPGAAMVIPPTTPAGGEDAPMKVTRSIMIRRPAGYPSSPRSAASTPPASPLGSTPPISPFAGGDLCLRLNQFIYLG